MSYEPHGTDLKARNGVESVKLPIPTNILVDQDHTVRNVHANPDHFRRLEPQEALNWIAALYGVSVRDKDRQTFVKGFRSIPLAPKLVYTDVV